MSDRSDKMEQTAKHMLEELQRARDEARVQLHLGGMEAKDAFAGLEGKLNAFEARAHEIGDDAAEELAEGFDHLVEAFRKLKKNLQEA